MITGEEGSKQVLCLAAAAFVIASGVYYFYAPFADNDLWGHIYFGRALLDSGQLPTTNEYSFTASSYPWINHEILAECSFAVIYERLGNLGLIGFKLLVGVATIAILAREAARRARNPIAVAIALFISIELLSWGFLVRPQIFTFLALALLCDRLWNDEASAEPTRLVALPLLFFVWTNTHGGVVAGFGVMVLHIAGRWPSLTRPRRMHLAAVAGCCFLALFANPYGAELPLFLARDVLRSRQITEWAPLPGLDPGHEMFEVVSFYGVTLVVLLAGLAINPGKRPWEVLALGLAVVASYRHQRHLPLLGILAAPFLAETIALLFAIWRRRLAATISGGVLRGIRAFAAATLLIAAFLQGSKAIALHSIYRGTLFVSPEIYPVDAVRFIQQQRLHGNLALPFDWGEYAIWHLYPACRVSIDGRYTTAYPDDVIDQSSRFDSGRGDSKSLVASADILLLERRGPLSSVMRADPEWQAVYSDPTAVVFLRKTAAPSGEPDVQSTSPTAAFASFP